LPLGTRVEVDINLDPDGDYDEDYEVIRAIEVVPEPPSIDGLEERQETALHDTGLFNPTDFMRATIEDWPKTYEWLETAPSLYPSGEPMLRLDVGHIKVFKIKAIKYDFLEATVDRWRWHEKENTAPHAEPSP
jgi:hypothetical protein